MPYSVKTEEECLSCFRGQVRRTLKYAGVDGNQAQHITRKAEAIIARTSLEEIPARTSTVIHRLLRQETCVDPYRQVKNTYNRIALRMLPDLERRVREARDRLEGGVRAALAGNVIDFGIYESIDLAGAVEEAFRLPLPGPEYRSFTQAIDRARTILYLCDNAGEIVFDRLLIEMLRERGKTLTGAVKGAAVINDATLADAAETALDAFCGVIDNGSDGIGTLLEDCSAQFMKVYRSADMIISKGQANYETLAGTGDDRIFFLFKVKCPVVARAVDRKNGDIVLMRNLLQTGRAKPDGITASAGIECRQRR